MTPRQRDLFAFLAAYLAEHEGVSPSYGEIRAHLGLKSKSGVARLVDGLVERGLIRREGGTYRARNLVLVGGESEFERGRRFERKALAREVALGGSLPMVGRQ